MEALQEFGFDRVADLKRASVIAVVTVVGENEKDAEIASRLPTEPSQFVRILELRVDSVLRGQAQPGQTFLSQNLGWMVEDGARRPYMYDEGTWLEVGDRALVALRGDGKDPQRSPLITHDAAFFLKDGQVQDTVRRKPIIRELEQLTEQQLKERVSREAAA